ncbi:XRE family transcriptional regulator [Acinetobacter baumannii]|uniref:XRE family transcriptional regulator n=2 Tax=Acinetobacter baumannii TaxID=470 RepID=UPI00044EB465|nr:S24 family peptidase [Acinetobacter baumannii]EHU2133744.1 helix-turn-helix domain-containing protein [Acinetobacter baumannii]EXE82270.1 helix-turn-helix family protein [Acinetobacter baumannii 42887]EYD39132.1 helix-turn-helix family protein [Acinetobacter baumannii 25493_6]EYS13306.1 helix-turn-helix family protein [Acinetobacter baumannii 25569_3]EYS26487.1 helix-turn-helix family protein [Acinetobacter baumannii 45052_5]
MSEINDRIIERMRELKLRQVDLIEATGAKKGTVSKWISGINTPSVEYMPALAQVLKTTESWLLTGKEPSRFNNLNVQEFMDKHGLTKKENSSFDTDNIMDVDVVDYEMSNGYVWIDVVEASFSCGTGESIEFHFDVINGKYPFPPSFFQRKAVDPQCLKLIKAKGDSMEEYIFHDDLVGIDISQTEIIDGEIYAVYFEGEGMIKKIFKEEGGSLILHSLNDKYRDRKVTEQNGINFKVMGRQVWRAG